MFCFSSWNSKESFICSYDGWIGGQRSLSCKAYLVIRNSAASRNDIFALLFWHIHICFSEGEMIAALPFALLDSYASFCSLILIRSIQSDDYKKCLKRIARCEKAKITPLSEVVQTRIRQKNQQTGKPKQTKGKQSKITELTKIELKPNRTKHRLYLVTPLTSL